MLLLEIGGEIVQLLCARCRVGVTENSDGRIVCLELVEIAVDIRVAEIVVEDDDGKIDVRIVINLIRVIFSDFGANPRFK